MAFIRPAAHCLYRYDPLDRLAHSEREGQTSLKFFYQKNRLTTHIQGHTRRTLLHANDYLLALQLGQNQTTTYALLATDPQFSVIATPDEKASFTPYGHRHPQANLLYLPGFKGQETDRLTGHYWLGNGYRAFNPVLMRFNSPDSLSPFGKGGLNPYAYCVGDPVNRVDPSGHMPLFLKTALQGLQPGNSVPFLLERESFISQRIPGIEQKNIGVKVLNLGYRLELGGGVNAYQKLKKNGNLELIVNGHAATLPTSDLSALIAQGKGYVYPQELVDRLAEQRVHLNNFENIHLVSCFLGTGGARSYAAEVARITKKPVKAYIGYVYTHEIRNIQDSTDNFLVGFYKKDSYDEYGVLREKPVYHSVRFP
ncbi:RHS repeat-associated core domain-containing protein [Pseudomonas asturiensis]|uniref:RHS repeat-associated core domain-containing protein n=1 Tax=Pseudomonas asturiensis TaxID=1190415 RepID=A0A1M7NKA0_9PSED|nr:RHS repeat-associated core domain-containing protein [Pseudomonas asturiensis]SHN04149.1 RHS repeat-associated core domain-containing protein [Pseudomonas asturiensis]